MPGIVRLSSAESPLNYSVQKGCHVIPCFQARVIALQRRIGTNLAEIYAAVLALLSRALCWSRLWRERASAIIRRLGLFFRRLGSSSALFTTLLCRRSSRCWRGSKLWRGGWWRGGKLLRRSWQFPGARCSDNWRSYSRRLSLASLLASEKLGNSRDNCCSHRDHSKRNCPAC